MALHVKRVKALHVKCRVNGSSLTVKTSWCSGSTEVTGPCPASAQEWHLEEMRMRPVGLQV